jgi:hypothetical protein
MIPAAPLTEPLLLAVRTPFTVSVTVNVPVESDTPAPWILIPAYFQGK